MYADGSDARRIGADHVGYRPVWSPDGTRIAYSSDDLVSVVNLDGTGDAYVAWGRWPVWRPTR
jgi:Tol biopolymer transport system component